MFEGTLQRIAFSSGLRVILTLLVGVFIGMKFPEGVQVACTVAEVLAVEVDLCTDGTMQ